MADIVRGEAPESDDDLNDNPKIFAAEVSGEATESDDEDVYEKSSIPTIAQVSSADSLYRQNLLQRKLIENNLCVWKALNALVKSFVLNASKQLVNTDQTLIKSQVSMQSVLSSLKLVQANASQLQKKSEAVFTTNFIPNIRIKKAVLFN